MKVSKLFHWLYASVMFIPIFILPIFALAVRSDNNFQPIEVEVNQQVQKINYKYETNDVNNVNDLKEGNLYHYTDIIDNSQINIIDKFTLNVVNAVNIAFDTANEISIDIYNVKEINYKFIFDSQYIAWDINGSEIPLTYLYLEVIDFTYEGALPYYFNNNTLGINNVTSSTFNQIESITTEGTLVTYNDTDVGSQMVYTLYNATDKYFNFNQFLGIGNLFDWFQLNVFNGNAPLGFYIFWNLLIYWLLVSIAWLIFDIAMFVPKLAHRWLDKASLE